MTAIFFFLVPSIGCFVTQQQITNILTVNVEIALEVVIQHLANEY